jgi:hypothetical protein
VKVAAPVPELFAVIVTFCGVAKLDGVNVSEPPAVTDSPLFPEVSAVVTVTFADGAADSDIPTVPVPPWVMFCAVGLTTRVPEFDVWPVHCSPFSVKAVGLVFVPLKEKLAPIWVDAPVPSEPFQLALVTVTAEPDWDQLPLHP